MRIRFQNHACNIASTERGDLELRIIGKNSYVTVAEVPFYDDSEKAKDYRTNAQTALKNWFSDGKYEANYRRRAMQGKANPHKTWKTIRKHNALTEDYDTE